MRTISSCRSSLRLVQTMCLLGWMMVSGGGAWGATYYVSSTSGKDTAAGTSEAAAWRSLGRAGQVKLEPGDRMLFRAGDRFEGTLRVDARGEEGRDVVFGVYGEGARPVLEGRGEEACVRLINPGHVTVQGLALTNEEGRYGVRMTAEDAGGLGRVTLENLEIYGIFRAAWSRPADPGHGEDKYYGGINAQVLRGQKPSWWEGIVIRNCNLHDLGTCGISIGSNYLLHERMRARRGQDSYPIKGVVVEGNVIRDVARDGAILRQCDGAVLQHNEVIRTGRVSTSNGLWFWDSQRSVIRHNVGRECGVRGKVDGGPFSIDYNSQDCVIEFNYSQDNEGPGFMVFGNHQTSTGSLVRGNVSYNDATAEARPGFAAVSMISTCSETVVEDNVVIAGPDTRVLLGHHDWEGMPTDVLYRGNVFVGNGRAAVEPSVLRGGRFEGNLFLNVPALPDGIQSSPDQAIRAFVEGMKRRPEVMEKAGRAGNDR